MAPHLTPAELDFVVKSARTKSSSEILAGISAARRKRKVEVPKVWAIRRALAGATHKRGVEETRGRNKKLNKVQASRLFDKRRSTIDKAKGEHYVSYDMIVKAARAPKVHRTTAAAYLGEMGVQWRRLREKPVRDEAHEEHRKEVCSIWRKRRSTFWTNEVDLIIDCKKYKVPSNAAAARRLKKQTVRGALRARSDVAH